MSSNSTAKKRKGRFDQFTLERDDIQAILVRGYQSLNAARYILLTIRNAQLAKGYFNELVEHITTSEKSSYQNPTAKGDPREAVHLAFTSTGLGKLGIPQQTISTFSRAFREGMSCANTHADTNTTVCQRSFLLGDTKQNAPDLWHWGNKEYPVDCVLMLYAESTKDVEQLVARLFTCVSKGVTGRMAEWYEYHSAISKEHFGFQDGIAQPTIKGLSQADEEPDDQKLINPGEFILGYKNEYDNYSPSPFVEDYPGSQELPYLPGFSDLKDLGKNGSYLVFRQIEQHVEKFWEFHYNQSKETGVTQTEKAVRLASKMIGRWPDGQPLVKCPSGDCLPDLEADNDFSYEQLDKYGLKCPLGAHIRRTNPRDQVHTGRKPDESKVMSARHRMLRRGRIYGKPLDKEFNIEKMIDKIKARLSVEASDKCVPAAEPSNTKTTIERGLHFICLVSDIERQFEFVQSVWANTSTFGDLCNEVDPIISPRPTALQPDCHEFTVPESLVRHRYKNVPQFTTVVGGEYFFLPGIRALKYIIGQ